MGGRVENSAWKVPSQHQQTIAIVIAKKQTSRRKPKRTQAAKTLAKPLKIPNANPTDS
jgi:hypothetical protein